jgi:NADH dehydrogenase
MSAPSPFDSPARPRVVVIGSGFGGLFLVRRLARAPVEIVLIDRTNHNLFQPLLYQVATAALSRTDIAIPIRSVLARHPNVTVLMAEATGIDAAARRVTLRDTAPIPYDYLVLATGTAYSYFGHADWAERALSLKSLDDAEIIRDRLLGAFERAESRTDPDEIARLLTFVVVGGGPTGVELSGAIAELARSTLARDFRRISPGRARIVLCEAGPRLLAEFPPHLSAYAEQRLRRLGVEVQTGTTVQQVDAIGLLAGGTRIEAATILWAAGTAARPAAQWLGAAAAHNGAVLVAPDCSVPGHPEVFAIGDVAALHGADGKTLPGLAPVAKQQGRYVADLIAARVAGRPAPGPFRYHDAGQLAILGRSAAIADFGRVKLTGVPAWLLWSAVHLLLLMGARNRVIVYVQWVWAWLTYGRGARVIDGRVRAPDRSGSLPP